MNAMPGKKYNNLIVTSPNPDNGIVVRDLL